MTLWSPPLPLPMSWHNAPNRSRSGRDTRVVNAACPRDGFNEMAVYRPDMHDVAWRQVTHRTPLREQPAPQTHSVQRLDGGHRCRTRGQHHQQVFDRLRWPRRPQFRRGFAESGQGGRCHRQAGGRRGRRHPQDQAGIALRAGIAGQDDLACELDDAFVQRTAHRPSKRGESPTGQGVGRGAQPGIDIETDRAGGVGKHAGQIESVPDAQRRADLVGVLGQHEFTAAAGNAVQLGANVEQGKVRLAQRLGRRRQRPAGIDVGQLSDRQGIEQLDIAQTTTTGLEVGLGAVGDLAAALPPLLGVFDEFIEARSDSGAPLPTRAADQQRGQV